MKRIYLVSRAESYGTQQVYWIPDRAFTTKKAAEAEAGRYGKVTEVSLYDDEEEQRFQR